MLQGINSGGRSGMTVSGIPAGPPPQVGPPGSTGTPNSTTNTSAPAGGAHVAAAVLKDKVASTTTPVGGGAGAVMGAANLDPSMMGQLLTVMVGVMQVMVQLVSLMMSKLTGGAMPGGSGVKGMSGEAAPAPVVPTADPNVSVITGANGHEDNAFEQRVTELVNAQRARYGLGPLTFNPTLDRSAEKHNAWQVSNRTMAHIGAGNTTPGDRIRAEGWGGRWGENVAIGQKTPEQVVSEWMNSPTHRANILNPRFTTIGVSYATTPDGIPLWAQSFGG